MKKLWSLADHAMRQTVLPYLNSDVQNAIVGLDLENNPHSRKEMTKCIKDLGIPGSQSLQGNESPLERINDDLSAWNKEMTKIIFEYL